MTDVKTDIGAHTVTVGFDDDQVELEAIIEALNKAGYTVGEPKALSH